MSWRAAWRRKLGIGGELVNRYDGYMTETPRLRNLDLLGGHAALDFVNTLDWRDRDAEAGGPEEYLVSCEAFLAWAHKAGLVTAAEERAFAAAAARDAPAAATMVREAVNLREAIYDLLDAARTGRRPAPAQLEQINRCLAMSPAAPRLTVKTGGYSWVKPEAEQGLSALLARLAQAAGELLTSDQLNRVGCCAGPGCGWLYLDTSPNRRRRWCSMDGCGNRAKAKRHYQRARQAS